MFVDGLPDAYLLPLPLPVREPNQFRPAAQAEGAPLDEKEVKTLHTLLQEHVKSSFDAADHLYSRNSLLYCIIVVCAVAAAVITCILPPLTILAALVPVFVLVWANVKVGDNYDEITHIYSHIDRINTFDKNPLYKEMKDLKVTGTPDMKALAELIYEIFEYEQILKRDQNIALKGLSTLIDPQMSAYVKIVSKTLHYDENEAKLAQKKEAFLKMIEGDD